MPEPSRCQPGTLFYNRLRPVMAGLGSSLGLLIGSLGASFEERHSFRQVIYADEERPHPARIPVSRDSDMLSSRIRPRTR